MIEVKREPWGVRQYVRRLQWEGGATIPACVWRGWREAKRDRVRSAVRSAGGRFRIEAVRSEEGRRIVSAVIVEF
jgi:hypothetical protein